MANPIRRPTGHRQTDEVHLRQNPPDNEAPTALVAGAATLAVTLPAGWHPKGFAQVEYYSDAAGATVVDPTAGTETVTMTPYFIDSTTAIGAATIYDQNDWSSGVLDHAAATPQGFSWNWPTKKVSVALLGIAGAAYARLRVGVYLQ